MATDFMTFTDDLVLPSIQQLHLRDDHCGLCFICDGATNDKSVQLQFGQTMHSKIGLPIKLGQLIGDDFMVIVSVDDRLCFTCIELINLADKLEIKLNDVKKVITEHLKTKYQLSDDYNCCDDVDISGSCHKDSHNHKSVTEIDDIVDLKSKDQPLTDLSKTDLHEKTKVMILESDSDVEIVEETMNNVKEDLQTKDTNSSSLCINSMNLSTLLSSDNSSPLQLVNQLMKPKDIQDKSTIENVNCSLDNVDSEVNSSKIVKPVTRIQVKKNIVCNKISNKHNLKFNKSPINRPAFKCKMCDEEFQTQVLLRRHIMKSHLSKWSCYFCSITFNNDSEYQNHMKTHIRNVKIQPQPGDKICDKNNDVDSSAEGSLHVEKQNEVKTFFKCKNCKFKTKFNFLLDKHESECCLGDTNSKNKTIECNLCSTVFKTSKKLNDHICNNNEIKNNVKDSDNIVDNTKKLTNFQCGICSVKFNDKSNLVQHLRIHKISKTLEKNILDNSNKLNSQTEIIQVDVDLNTNENDFDLNDVQMVDDGQISSISLINCDDCSLSFDKQSSFLEHISEHKNKISDCNKNVEDNDTSAAEIYFDNVKHFMAMSSETSSINLSVNKGSSLNFNVTNEETNTDKKTDTDVILASNFICDTCNTSFSDKNDLDKHTIMYDHKLKQNFGDFKYNLITSDSNIDNKVFENENEVKENKSNSAIESQFVSKIIINSLNTNLEDDAGDGGKNIKNFDHFPCQLCSYIALSLNELKSHEIIDHNVINDMIICNICDKFIMKSDENEHYNSHKTIYCKYCSFETKSQKLMVRHIKEHNNKNNSRKEKLDYLCQYCSETFKTKKLLKSHEELHPENFEFHCSECDKKFMKEKQLKNHYDEIHRDPHCCYCGKEILNLKALKNHEQRHIRDLQNSNKLECDICKKVFKTKTGLRHHFAVHTGKFTYFCDFCQRGFMSRMMLEEHRSRHTKEDRYVCDVCGRKFTFQSTYWIHRKWHDTPFPYKCNYCGRLFKHTSLLAVHKRKHTGERPYKCPHCPLSFTVGGTLKRHLILHTQKFPFWCEACKRGFTTKHKYSVHLSKIHNNDELLTDKKASRNQTDYKMVVKDKLTISSGDSENEKLSSTSRDQTDNFEFMPDSTNFTLVNMEEDDTGNSAVMMPCIMTTVNNEENSGLVFEIISGSPLQQISNSITLPENSILPDMWCQ